MQIETPNPNQPKAYLLKSHKKILGADKAEPKNKCRIKLADVPLGHKILFLNIEEEWDLESEEFNALKEIVVTPCGDNPEKTVFCTAKPASTCLLGPVWDVQWAPVN